MVELHLEELEAVEAPDARDFVEGVAIGLGIVAAIVTIAT